MLICHVQFIGAIFFTRLSPGSHYCLSILKALKTRFISFDKARPYTLRYMTDGALKSC